MITLNILLLSNMGPSAQIPNSGRFVHNQFIELSKFEHMNVEFFYLNQDEKTGLAKLLRYPLFFFRFVFNYVFSKKKLNVIHVHFYFPLILFAIVYKIFRNWRLKIVVTFHGSDIYSYSPPNVFYKIASYSIDQFIFVSQSLYSKFYRKVHASILSAGVLDSFYHASSDKRKKKYDLIFVGHLNFNKGIDRLIKIINSVEIPLNIAIIGTGKQQPIETKYENQIRYFEFLSPEELLNLYQESKFLINLSRNESFGLVMTEAMACGTPVIATETDGALAQVINKKNGFIWKNCDEWICKSASKQLHSILSISEEDYDSFVIGAINSAEQHKLSKITVKLDEIYSQLMDVKYR